MQHLGAVVRDLGRFAMVELRNQPRVGHEPRIGGEDAGHVLPEHDALGAERAREERRRQIRAAAAERRHAAVRRLADEAGHDGNRPCRERAAASGAGRDAPWLGEVRRRAAVLPVGDDDLGRIDVGGRAAALGPAPPRGSRRHPLAARDEQVARARREVAEHRRPRRRARDTRAPRASIVASSRRRAGPAGTRPRATSR